MTRVFAVLAVQCVVLAAPAVSAQSHAAMLQTGATGENVESVRSAFDRLARSRFERLAPMSLDAAPPLPLEDLQLAVGCIGESADCLRAVAERVGVQVMVVPSIERTDGSLVASFLLLDTADDDVRRVTRRAENENELFDRVDPMLRELFDLPPPEPEETPTTAAATGRADPSTPDVVTPAEPSPGFPTGPAIVGGVGVLAIAAAVVVGALSESAERAYADADTSTRAGVDMAETSLSEARAEATAANVLFAVGGAAMVGALVWWLVGADSPFGVSASPEGVAFHFAGRFGGDS